MMYNNRKLPKLVMKEYTLLDGTKKTMLKQVGGGKKGKIIDRFEDTPPPVEYSDVVCPHFIMLKWGYGCDLDPGCAWCYLQGTLRRLKTKKKFKAKDYSVVERHVRAFFQYPERELANAGELCDSLMTETRKRPFTKFIVPLFNEQNTHELLLLTKIPRVENLLELDGKRTIVSFSINSKKVAERWEGVPHPYERIEAAGELIDTGYRVRMRLDPVLPVSGWVVSYRSIIDKMMKKPPQRITIGSLRGNPATIGHAKDKSWVYFLKNGERTNFGTRIAFKKRHRVFQELLRYLHDQYNFKEVGLCKETLGMWKELEKEFGINYQKMKCNCIF